MKQTNWKNIKEGTPVLFRRSKYEEYEEGKWYGGFASHLAYEGAFCLYVSFVPGSLFRIVSAHIDPETDEWHVDEHYLKLAA